ncbi:MAG TPA: hypothetical protein PKX00_01235 [Opitutaceae bacterium]|nr:hypothetical protein [Opitutaceae bacterium]
MQDDIQARGPLPIVIPRHNQTKRLGGSVDGGHEAAQKPTFFGSPRSPSEAGFVGALMPPLQGATQLCPIGRTEDGLVAQRPGHPFSVEIEVGEAFARTERGNFCFKLTKGRPSAGFFFVG